jgi:hypothetical protein
MGEIVYNLMGKTDKWTFVYSQNLYIEVLTPSTSHCVDLAPLKR